MNLKLVVSVLMNFWKYLIPENPIAQFIAYSLMVLAAVWVVMLIRRIGQTVANSRQIKRLENVDTLAEALRARTTSEKTLTAEADSTRPGDEEPSSIAAAFFEDHGVSEQSPVARHVKSIFMAGWNESRLDAGELIKHTSNELFKDNGFLRSVLAIFIIVGLLGTLFGLADSLSHLAPLIQVESISSKELARALTDLLGQLKSAFAPSILGVLLTVVGVLIFSAYLHLLASPTRGLLERFTLAVWVPQLFPTSSQRLLETLQFSEKQMRRNVVAAQQVVVFAESIQNEAGDLHKNIQSANKTLGSLEQSSNQINKFTDKFVWAVNSLAPFQQDLRTLYQQMLNDSTAFQTGVTASMKGSETLLENTVGVLGKQNDQLQSVLTALRTYEAAYVNERQQIDASIKEVLEAARKVFEDTGTRNQEVVEAVGAPLRAELTERLEAVELTLAAKLESIVQSFGAFDAPIKQAAQKIEGSLENVVKRTEKLTQELQGEFLKQNETNQKQLQQIGEFNERIVSLLTELAQSSKSQAEKAETLAVSMDKLVVQLAQFNQTSPVHGAPGSNGDIRSLNSSVEGLLRNSTDQSRQIQSLTSDVRAISGDLSAIRASGGNVNTIVRVKDYHEAPREQAPSVHVPNTIPTAQGRVSRFRAWLRRRSNG